MSSRHSERIISMQALYSWHITESSEESILTFSWLPDNLRQEEHELSVLLVQGVMHNLKGIDETIQKHMDNWYLDRLDRVDLSILRQGTYELQYTDTPATIVIDESVEIAKQYASEQSPAFINAVLDAIAKKPRLHISNI